MDSSLPPKPDVLLDDLEAIRQLLEKDQLEPPLLTETLDDELQIPLLSDIIEPGQAAASSTPVASMPLSYPAHPAVIPALSTNNSEAGPDKAAPLDSELRAAAQLILQEVIDDFVPQIEAELQRRLAARLDRLLKARS